MTFPVDTAPAIGDASPIPGEPSPLGWVAIIPPGTAVSETAARAWLQSSSLVLEARWVSCRVEHGEGTWHLLVPAEELTRALEELRLYEEENRGWPPAVTASLPLPDNSLTTLSVLTLLATFYNLTLLDIPFTGQDASTWILLGSADAGRILAGQWWRVVTALTLHRDWLHLFSNIGIGGIFILFLCRDLGSGLAWSLLLGSGILGNLANAWFQPPDHSSVGFSTAVFGAVGILAASTLVSYREEARTRWLRPVAAALALLALLGTEGKSTDLGAHLFGFVYGMAVGLVGGYWVRKYGRPGRWGNRFLGISCIIAVLAAWWEALSAGG